MNKNLKLIIDQLLKNSSNPIVLKLLNKTLNQGIPFNIPHKFKFIEVSPKKVIIELPYTRNNRNHLGGIHACATATLGEYPAGLLILKYFGIGTYRIIMSHLEVNYLKQAKEAITGHAILEESEIERMHEELALDDCTEIEMLTEIKNKNQEVIATVETTWQLKKWDKVRFK